MFKDKQKTKESRQTPQRKALEAAPRRGAVQHRVGFTDRFNSWRRHHQRVAGFAFKRLWQTPVATVMTLAVLAIALALPSFMFAALKNIQQLSDGLDTAPHISLYLKSDLSSAQVDRFMEKLNLHDELKSLELIRPEQGLREFKSYSDFGQLLDFFDSNPLPAVVIATPKTLSPTDLGTLRVNLQAMTEVDEARLDLEWVQRLRAFTQLAERGAWVLGSMLALTVLLVVGNTVRMTIESRKEEIVVTKLVGATDAWVRRPFLYSGIWFGLLGAGLGWLLAQIGVALIRDPVEQLAQLYLDSYRFLGIGVVETFWILLAGAALGLLGAWLAVSRHLHDIEPG